MADSGVDTSNESSDNPVFPRPAAAPGPAAPETASAFEWNLLEWVAPRARPEEQHELVRKIKAKRPRRVEGAGAGADGGALRASRNQRLRLAASTNNVELVERLLAAGTDPDARESDVHLRSPLHLAACRGYVGVVRALLRHGADPNVRDALGNTPLHLAACTSHIPVVNELLDAGTDVTSNDKHGRTPIQLAQSKLKLIQMRPSGAGHFEETKQLIQEICMVVEMMLKYMRVQKADAAELETLRERLANISTIEQVDSEVQCLLNSLDGLTLR